MNFTTTVTRESADKLSCESWRFTLLDYNLVLDAYAKGTRPTTRHKFQFGSGYSRLNSRDHRLPEADVPWPADVVEEARAAFITEINARLRVGRWDADLKKAWG